MRSHRTIEIDGIATTVDDLTVIVGDATTVNETDPRQDGINMSGAGAQTLQIINAGSSVSGANSGPQVQVTGGVSDLGKLCDLRIVEFSLTKNPMHNHDPERKICA